MKYASYVIINCEYFSNLGDVKVYNFNIEPSQIKLFMNKLLIENSFDDFELRECTIATKATFSICFPAFAFGVQSYLRWYGLLHKFTIFSREVVEIHHCRRFEERPEDGNTDCRRAIERETTKNMTIK